MGKIKNTGLFIVSFVFKIKILDMTTSDSGKSYASAAASNATTAKTTGGSGHGSDPGFKARQRPDAIRNSNIVAAKGNTNFHHLRYPSD